MCPVCNNEYARCICIKTKECKKIILSVTEEQIKKSKFVTIVHGIDCFEDFKTIKNKVGTGGTFIDNVGSFRGRISKRILKILHQLGYTYEHSPATNISKYN